MTGHLVQAQGDALLAAHVERGGHSSAHACSGLGAGLAGRVLLRAVCLQVAGRRELLRAILLRRCAVRGACSHRHRRVTQAKVP